MFDLPARFYEIFFDVFAFVLGATVGSFLNVCIYRLPLGLSVNEPKRSFCPSCKYQIPFSKNIPLISWLALGGKCANCGSRISIRYFGVELLTALLFLAVWLKCTAPGQLVFAFPYWILTSLLITATFIDFEHMIIPDEITKGGVVAGIILSAVFPALMRTGSHWQAPLWSALGAAAGYFSLWGVVEFGKIAFGKKKIALKQAESFSWERKGEDAELKIGEETHLWSETFARESDRFVLQCPEFDLDGKHYTDANLQFYHDRVVVGETEHKLETLAPFSGKVTAIIIPREAMGFGDVKFLAAIGAFLGWQAVFFTIASASIIGALVGSVFIVFKRRSVPIPFGPYLAAGALIWMFAGWDIIHWYLNRMLGD
ncbi:MAG TPA: prepilin peptidase [Chthoniobacteraceae bacterium]|nr:prepilin peptidase [Chthoniobacteraceae bacterium]